jgi:hypothetical protein
MNDYAWRTSLKIGDFLDCLDTDNKWFEGVILNAHPDGVTVHFRGWNSRYDVFESFFSARIQQPYTKSKEWRRFIGVGDMIEVKDDFNGTYLWFVGTIVRVNTVSKEVHVRYGLQNRLKVFDIEGEYVSYLGTHIRIDQDIKLTKETIDIISSRHFERWSYPRVDATEDSPFMCCICYINTKNVLLTPCNHLCVCSKCSTNASLHKCPLCNENIVSKINVYV